MQSLQRNIYNAISTQQFRVYTTILTAIQSLLSLLSMQALFFPFFFKSRLCIAISEYIKLIFKKSYFTFILCNKIPAIYQFLLYTRLYAICRHKSRLYTAISFAYRNVIQFDNKYFVLLRFSFGRLLTWKVFEL